MDGLTANHVFKKPELALFGADLARARQAPLDGRQTTVLTPCPRTTGVSMHQILQDKSLFRPHCLINGQWRDAADKSVLDVVNPANGKLLGTVPNCGADEARLAVEAAHSAFALWKDKTP